jgi:hypothetical protein
VVRQLSDVEVHGDRPIARATTDPSQIRDEAATYLRIKRVQVRSLAYWWAEPDLAQFLSVHIEAQTQH